MSIYDPRRRFSLSVLAALGFVGAYVLFRAFTSPFLEVEREKTQYSKPVRSAGISPEARRDAEKWFLDHPWVARSGKHFRHSGRYMFCKTFELSEDKKSITVKPLAMMWRADEHSIPIRVVSDSATLFGASEFSLSGSELGQISGGLLSGNVQIRGPDNLRLNGGTFRLEDSPMKLWSSEPIDCTWGRHTGRSESGVEIFFNDGALEKRSTESIARLQLLGRVQCQFLLSGDKPGDEPTTLHVRAARGFVFRNDPVMKSGTFYGFRPSGSTIRGNNARAMSLDPEKEVWIRRVSPDGSVDDLICPELVLTFRDATDPETGAPESGSMQLEHLHAWGRRVELLSPQRDVRVIANDFQYSVDQRQIDIRYTTNDVSDRRRFVMVQSGQSLLTVPHIRILHTAENDLQRLECNGAGGFRAVAAGEKETTNKTEKAGGTVEGRWGGSLVFQASPEGGEQYVTISGGGAFGELSRQMALSAQKITLTMAMPTAKPSKEADEIANDSSSQISDFASMFDNIEPRLLTATGNVLVKSPEASGRLRENLTVRFINSVAPGIPVRQISESRTLTSAEDQDKDAKDEPYTLTFTSDSGDAEVTLVTGRETDKAPPYRVWLKGRVDVKRDAKVREKSFSATGNQLVAVNSQDSVRTIQLFGDPARVNSATRNLEGPRIDLNELSGHAEVVGSGRIRFETTRGFDGRELPQPTPIDIYWSDHMQFHERSARFVGKVRVVMSDGRTQDLELLCSGLTVWFSADVALNPTDEGTFEAVFASGDDVAEKETGPIERIECHDRVDVNVDQFESGNVIGRHRAAFADLKVNLQTGDFNAIGPGYLESVSPDREGRLQGVSSVTVRPNAPSRTRDTAFVYLKAEFVGDFSGNIDQQAATLSQNVVALLVPTRHVDETVNLHETPTANLPERAGILQAESLTIGAVPGRTGGEDTFSIDCRKNARLESRDISASADVITYDHAKEQFIIRAEGNNSVTVNHRRGSGGQFNRTSGSRFEYYRQTNQLKADQIDRVNLGD